ncbi:E3 ubiquitin-protein ligase ORTHRUS 1-like protein, partial [Drosera capensis]
EFSCLLCRKVLNLPITTPCAHNFCKSCLDAAFSGQTLEMDRNRGGRQLRTKKNIMKCPSCAYDIAEFLQTAQVNKELMAMLESVKRKLEEEEKSSEAGEGSSGAGSEEDAISEGEEGGESKGEEGGESEPEETDKPRATKRQKFDGENKEIEMAESDEVKSKPKVPSNKSKRIAGPKKAAGEKPTAGAACGEDEVAVAAGDMKQGPKGPCE